MNEIELFKNARPDVAPYASTARDGARQRLLAQAGPMATEFRWRRVSVVAVAASSVLAVGAAVTHIATEPRQGEVVAAPALTTMSVTEVLGRAASAVDDGLTPRDDQFVVVESQTMYEALSIDTDGEERWLYRTHRTIWQSADGSKEGVLRVETQRPAGLPGWPIPEIAYNQMGSELLPLGKCEVPEDERTDYASLRKLPTDQDGMRTHLYDRAVVPESTATADDLAWERAGTLLRETYLPPAQRAALFQAIATIDGVSVVDDLEDAAGRSGIGVGRASFATRTDLIFDRDTYELLGERAVVVDAERAGVPAGTLVASTAQLEVSVSDVAPEIGPIDATISC